MFGLCFDLMLYHYPSGQVRDNLAHCDTAGISSHHLMSSLGRCLCSERSFVSQCAELGYAPGSHALFMSVGSCQPCAAYVSVMRIPKLHLLLCLCFFMYFGIRLCQIVIPWEEKVFHKAFWYKYSINCHFDSANAFTDFWFRILFCDDKQ